MFGLHEFLMSDEQKRAMRERRQRHVEERLTNAVPWDPAMKWQPHLTLEADTYKTLSLFDVRATTKRDPNDADLKETIHSPKKTFCYLEKRLKRGGMLETGFTMLAHPLIQRPEPLLSYPRIRIYTPPNRKLLLHASKLYVDEVTRVLRWHLKTFEQELIDETEARMAGPGWQMGIDWGAEESTTAFWKKMAVAMQVPIQYITQQPPAGASLTLKEKA